MANKSGKAYALTLLCPIRSGQPKNAGDVTTDQTYSSLIRRQLQELSVNEQSPMARVPNTYLCRLFILEDVLFQGLPAAEDHLKSKYLVFSANFHGDLEPYLTGFWPAIGPEISAILRHCVGFEDVTNAASFIRYVKACQVPTTFFFNGSSDEPLETQLKSLYLKQEFSRLVFENQGKSAAEQQTAFEAFVARTQPANLARPTWKAGAYHLDRVVLE